ncbi:hypothetical protein COCOBI_01-7700 [Coccomyxa sp. Obi]|nr:hypothetical protein COCOBI_01-7700 [Coccomyxa sp. Obi]
MLRSNADGKGFICAFDFLHAGILGFGGCPHDFPSGGTSAVAASWLRRERTAPFPRLVLGISFSYFPETSHASLQNPSSCCFWRIARHPSEARSPLLDRHPRQPSTKFASTVSARSQTTASQTIKDRHS